MTSSASVRTKTKLRTLALQRLRRNPWLQGSMVAALIAYGGTATLILADNGLLPASAAILMVCLSLASWSLLFWWLPILERTERFMRSAGRGSMLASVLEFLATACIVVVHALYLGILYLRATQS